MGRPTSLLLVLIARSACVADVMAGVHEVCSLEAGGSCGEESLAQPRFSAGSEVEALVQTRVSNHIRRSKAMPSKPAVHHYRKEEGVGKWGGICTCPDGQQYEVGDNDDHCASLACENGVYTLYCSANIKLESHGMKVTCAGEWNNYYRAEPDVGGYAGHGGICTCPDGSKYEVGDYNDWCASLACENGQASECTEGGIQAASAGMKVTCGEAPPKRPASSAVAQFGRYVKGQENTNSCPTHSFTIGSKSECELAAFALGKTWKGEERDESAPRGCYLYDGRDLWVNYAIGSSRNLSEPICMQSAMPSALKATTAAPTRKSSTPAPPPISAHAPTQKSSTPAPPPISTHAPTQETSTPAPPPISSHAPTRESSTPAPPPISAHAPKQESSTPAPPPVSGHTTPAVNHYRKEAGVGSWGGICTCPDGQQYEVGDNGDFCESIACENGVYTGSCSANIKLESHGMKVTCAGKWNNNYRFEEDVGGAEGYGGTCTCPDGSKYQVGDNNDWCASLACENGEASECAAGSIQAAALGMKVTCGQSPPEGQLGQ